MDRLVHTNQALPPIEYAVHGFLQMQLARNILLASARDVLRRANPGKNLDRLIIFLSQTLKNPNQPLTLENLKWPKKQNLRQIETLAKKIDPSLRLICINGKYKLGANNEPSLPPAVAIIPSPIPIQIIEKNPTSPISVEKESSWRLQHFIKRYNLFTQPNNPAQLFDDLTRGLLIARNREGFIRNIMWQIKGDLSISLLRAFINRLLLCDLEEIKIVLQDRQDDALLFNDVKAALFFSSGGNLPDNTHFPFPIGRPEAEIEKLIEISKIYNEVDAGHTILL